MPKNDRRTPTRAEMDAEFDRRLDKAAAWLHREDLDAVAVQIHRETWIEFRLLGHLPADQRTPAIVERLDQLRRDLTAQATELGLTPAARKGLGMGPTQVAAQRPKGLAYRRPGNPQALLKNLVRLGVMDAVIAEIKAELTAEQNTN